MGRSNIPELPYTVFKVLIDLVLNGNGIVLSHNQLQVSYTHVRLGEELIDIIGKYGDPKERYILILLFRCTFRPDELEDRVYRIL
jgi:hypothetical protein